MATAASIVILVLLMKIQIVWYGGYGDPVIIAGREVAYSLCHCASGCGMSVRYISAVRMVKCYRVCHDGLILAPHCGGKILSTHIRMQNS